MHFNQITDDFFRSFPLHSIKKGIVLFDPFQRPSGLYYLIEGYVRQYSLSEEGKELTIHIYTPHTQFPLFWLLAAHANRFYFQTMTPIICTIIPRKQALEFFEKNPSISLEVTKNILQGMDGLIKRIELDAFHNARTKVISTLLYLGTHFGTTSGSEIRIHEHFTHEKIASLIGITREHVSLELETLQKEKRIIQQNHEIIIPNINLLTSEYHYS